MLRLVPAHRDACGTLPQVRGSSFDSLRLGQTPDSCLWVKGSPVQIRPSRRRSEATSWIPGVASWRPRERYWLPASLSGAQEGIQNGSRRGGLKAQPGLQ